MCGGQDDATKEAQRAEEARQRQVREATAAIEGVFGGESRQGQLDDFVSALREKFGTEAARQKEQVGRRAKFATARSGLTGGSADADLRVGIGRDFQKGILEGERLSQSALADLLQSDAQSKQNLTSLAQGGADISTAARQASQALQSNLAGARAGADIRSLGDIFGDTRGVLLESEKAAARRRGLRDSEVFANPFSRGTG